MATSVGRLTRARAIVQEQRNEPEQGKKLLSYKDKPVAAGLGRGFCDLEQPGYYKSIGTREAWRLALALYVP